MGPYQVNNMVNLDFFALFIGILCIAIQTPEITSCEAHKDAGPPCVRRLTLNAVKYFVDFKGHLPSHPTSPISKISRKSSGAGAGNLRLAIFETLSCYHIRDAPSTRLAAGKRRR
jgi:hypothetical protein